MKQFFKNTAILVMIMVFSVSTYSLMAQKYAYVDTEYILENIPEFGDAQDELDDMSKRWQKEIEQNYATVEQLYKKLPRKLSYEKYKTALVYFLERKYITVDDDKHITWSGRNQWE